MKYCLIPALCLLTAGPLSPARADENEAEKLFRAMEKKITGADAFKMAVAIDGKATTADREGHFQGSLVLTNDNKVRLKFSGDDVGEAVNWEMVSDGKQVYLKPYDLGASEVSKEEEKLPTPKNLHGHLATRVSRVGVYLSLLRMAVTVLQADDPGARLEPRHFKERAREKVGGRDARVITFRLGLKDEDGVPVTLWIDSKTLLPLKRVIDFSDQKGSLSGIIITENYELDLEPKITTRAFRLPKMKVPREENVPLEKVPQAVREAVEKRFPKATLGSAVLARPGSSWLRRSQTKAVYILVLGNGRLRIVPTVLPDGTITEYLNEIKPADLPKGVKDYLDRHVPGASVQEADEIFRVKEGKEKLEHVKVFLTAAGRSRVLVISPEGKLLADELPFRRDDKLIREEK